ncbi:MAG: hypothetical protein JZU65_24005 [Chlorobium sp.]|nr:hypothetical protein [Chlorobium sp.]
MAKNRKAASPVQAGTLGETALKTTSCKNTPSPLYRQRIKACAYYVFDLLLISPPERLAALLLLAEVRP